MAAIIAGTPDENRQNGGRCVQIYLFKERFWTFYEFITLGAIDYFGSFQSLLHDNS
jgi:hypothetical protein